MRVEGGVGSELAHPELGDHALGLAELLGHEGLALLSGRGGDLVLLGGRVIGHLAIDGARLDQPVAEPLLPQLDHETHVHGHAAVQAFVQIGGDGPEEHALHGDVEVVQEDREAGDPEVTLGSSGHRGQTEQKQQ